MSTPCQQIHDVANRMLPNMSAGQINAARADLRRIADKVKELEMFHAETLHQREEAEMVEAAAQLATADVYQFDAFRRAPVGGGAA